MPAFPIQVSTTALMQRSQASLACAYDPHSLLAVSALHEVLAAAV